MISVSPSLRAPAIQSSRYVQSRASLPSRTVIPGCVPPNQMSMRLWLCATSVATSWKVGSPVVQLPIDSPAWVTVSSVTGRTSTSMGSVPSAARPATSAAIFTRPAYLPGLLAGPRGRTVIQNRCDLPAGTSTG